MSLLDDLKAEEASPGRDYGCTVCDALDGIEDVTECEALAAAIAGTMSERALLRISAKYNLGIGRAGLRKHRQEGH